MTQSRAHEALFAFLQRANHQGFSFVLVITGSMLAARRRQAEAPEPTPAAA